MNVVVRCSTSLTLAALLLSCNDGSAERPPLGCTSSTECELGQLCHPTQQVCVDEPKNAVIGRFYCSNVGDPSAPPVPTSEQSAGISELGGYAPREDGGDPTISERLSFYTNPKCFIDGSGFILNSSDYNYLQGKVGYTLVVMVPSGTKISPGAELSLDSPDYYYAMIAQCNNTTSPCPLVAGNSHATITFDAVPQLGKPVGGSIVVQLEAIQINE